MIETQLLRIVLLLAVFGSVFLIVQVALRTTVARRAYSSAINRRMKLIERGTDREEVVTQLRKNDPLALGEGDSFIRRRLIDLHRKLMMAGIASGPNQVAMLMLGLFVVLAAALSVGLSGSGYQLTSGVIQVILAVSVATAIAIPYLVIGFLAQRRQKKMQEQFPVALDIFVRALRSGHPIASAIELLTTEMEDPIGSEFGLVADEISYGAELTEALHAMAERWNLDDIRMFVVSLSVQNETGGNLAEILENLSNVIRERMAMYLKVRALSSEGRMTGWLLTALPIIAFVLVFMMNPAFYLGVAGDPIFYIGFPMIIGWFVIGVFWIRNMVNLQV